MALAPCFIPSSDSYVEELTIETYSLLAGIFEVLDIESLMGPNWNEQRQDLCNVFGNDSLYCAALKEIKVGPIAGGSIEGYSEIGVQQLQHLGQLALTGRFQYFQETFLVDQLFGVSAPIVDVSKIKEPPIKFIYIDGDQTCPFEKQRPFMEQIPAWSGFTTTLFNR